MKERPKKCKTCMYYECLPFADEYVCANENSDYADCSCSENDTCSEYRGRED